MSRIVIIGGHGKVALLLSSILSGPGGSASLDEGEAKLGPPHGPGGSASLDEGEAKLGPPHGRGHQVSSVFRNPEHTADVAATGATPVVADIEQLDTGGLAELVAGHDAVVFSAGAGGGNPARTYAVDRDAAIRTIDAATQAGVRRFVMVSYFGAGPGHGVPEGDSFFPYAQAKAAADAHLRASDLDWTVLGPSGLTLAPATGRIEVNPSTGKGEVSRGNVAQVIAACLVDPSTAHRTIDFNDGQTPIPEALRAD